MGLNLPQILGQLEKMSAALAEQQAALRRLLPAARKAFEHAASLTFEELDAQVKRAGDRYRGARPTEEPLLAVFEPPPLDAGLVVAGADGSQIYPDRHAPALYFAVQVGGLAMEIGSGLPPQVRTQSQLYYQQEDLHDQQGYPIGNAMVNGRRDAQEMKALADWAGTYAGRPLVALLDNGLLLWFALQVREQNQKDVDLILQAYLGNLDRLRDSGGCVAGFIDRPRSADVLALAHLATLPPSGVSDEALRVNPFRALTDRALFEELLQPGQRSACFIDSSPLNEDFRKKHHEVLFFYLKTDSRGTIARVEVPAWVAKDTALLGCVHAAILDQCRSTGGFPYVLVRAHELAVITNEDRQQLEGLIQQRLLESGLGARPSQKATTKRWTRSRRKHRL
ncbi:MAG: DNA double-strand break repair nuclease NurA [Chloroflexi bacterium]|nr:DNA double-strand break repair nuclease NurA [Chloroflexota bacterium]